MSSTFFSGAGTDSAAGGPGEYSADDDAEATELVDAFVGTRAERGALDADEIETLARVAALIARQTGAARDSSARAEIPERAMVAELASAAHASERTVRRQMADAADLCARFSATVSALRAGAISRGHVSVIHEAGHAIDDADARARYEEFAIDRAKAMTAGRLRPIVEVIAARVNPRTIDERHAEARRGRTVWVTDLADGMAQLTAVMAATLAHGTFDRLTQQAHAVITARTATDTALPDDEIPEGIDADTRSLNEVRADVFADLLLTGTPETAIAGDGLSSIRAIVQVTVPVLTALSGGGEAALLAGHGPIDADTARRLAGGAKGWERVMTSPSTGGILAVDRYRPSKELIRHLRARDEHCRFFGCRMPVWRSDIDHTIDAALGGPTSSDNLAHACRAHHIVKHASRWKVRQRGGGVLEWTSPLGKIYIDTPDAVLRFTAESPPDTEDPGWFAAPTHA